MKRVTLVAMFVFAVFTCSFSLSGCVYDSEEELYGRGCDTTNVTYSITIKKLLENNSCLTCHVGNNPSGGFTLETYANVKAKLAGDTLWRAINHLPGVKPMPDGGDKMSQCDINKVKAWIDGGALDN